MTTARQINGVLVYLSNVRSDIDSVDSAILDLLVQRKRLSQEIRKVKADIGHPLTDLAREREIIGVYVDVLDSEHGSRIAHSVLDFSKA